MIRCTDCSPSVVYCSKACQIAHWPSHIIVCYAYQGKTVPTAYHLAHSCYLDLLPADKQTLEDYGFNRACMPLDQMMLMGLYQGLFKCFGINPETVHTWKQEGLLIQEIKKVFEEIPSQYRGQYYAWFLDHQDLLDPSLEPLTKTIEDFALEATMRAWWYTGGRQLPNGTRLNDINIEKATWPVHKRNCFDLCILMLSNSRPTPSFCIWITFGFCTTRNEHEETQLCFAYHTLLMRCSFEEFYRASESSSLVQLFNSKHISLEQSGPHLADLLAYAPHTNKSVWNLKQFVIADESDGVPVVCPVGIDYGFYNCRTQEQVLQLKKFYKKFFDDSNGDPLELHQACLQGKIYNYVRTTVKLNRSHKRSSFRQLVMNPYPLPQGWPTSLAGITISGDMIFYIGRRPHPFFALGFSFTHHPWLWSAFIALALALIVFYFH
jgi:hypothetical protein